MRLSYQTHKHRAEHWFVVTGTASCLIDEKAVVVSAGGSVDIAIGQPHRIGNNEEQALVIIEIQRGSYLGEDDIVRLEDDFGRA